jgi:hypothetical protein
VLSFGVPAILLLDSQTGILASSNHIYSIDLPRGVLPERRVPALMRTISHSGIIVHSDKAITLKF